jgi:tetratricopeptide (TPR) repeat protein
VPYLHLRPSTVYMADRYLFCLLPFLAIVLVLTVRPLLPAGRPRLAVVVLTAVVLAGVSVETHSAWRSSEALWTRMTAVYPQSDWGFHRLGRRLYALQQYEAAAGAWLAAAERDPQDSQHLNNAAVAAMALGRDRMAIEWLRKAVTIDPGNRAAWGNLKKLGAAPRP